MQRGPTPDYQDGVSFAASADPLVCSVTFDIIEDGSDRDQGIQLASVHWSTTWLKAYNEANPEERADIGRSMAFARGVVDTCLDS